MKNSIRIFVLAVCCVSAVLFSSCKKEQHNALKVSIESPASTAKAHLVNYYPNFIEGDLINVNGVIYQSQEAGTTCEFWATGGDDVDSPYYAVYPASCVNGIVTDQPRIILPEVQQYVAEGDVQKLEAPMGGANTEPLIKFHNFCSVIEVAVKNPTGAPVSVTSVEVSSPDVRLSYPGGLQLATAMDKDHPDNVQALVANETYTKTNDSDPDEDGVTLSVDVTNGSIAPNSSKSFLVYLPTYKHVDGSQMVLHVKVTAVGTDYLASYTRSVRLDSLQRNIVYHYNFSLSESIRKVEDRFFNVGSGYIAFTKHNEGAEDQKGLGTPCSTSYTGTNVLTSDQWSTLFAQTGKSGLVQCGSNYYWALLPPGFEYPKGCVEITAITAATADKDKSTYTVTVKDNFNDMSTVTVYTDSQWSQMEAAGAVFLPIDGTVQASPTEKSTVTQYTYYYVPGMANKANMYFYFNAVYDKKDGIVTLKAFSIQAGTNRDKMIDGGNTPPYYVRTIQHMNLTSE